MTWRARLAFAAALACATWPAGAEESSLEPHQMVRSLQLVQDRVAVGDHAALPIQRKLLEMIDARFRTASPESLAEPANLHALMIYAMSGGNPATFRQIAPTLKLAEHDSRILLGLLSYLQGATKAAAVALKPIEPFNEPRETAAALALVKGSVVAMEEPEAALKFLDQARLLAPGTLIEEAALRRSVALAGVLGDPERFALASDQYVRSYLRSPYASQFADALVNGIIALHEKLDLERIDATTMLMSAEQRKIIYLRVARRAAIDGMVSLSAYAAGRAESQPVPDETGSDPRMLLYKSLTTVANETSGEIRERLANIDRSQLTAGDQQLLDAVRTVAGEIDRVPEVPDAVADETEDFAAAAPLVVDAPVAPAPSVRADPAPAVRPAKVPPDTGSPLDLGVPVTAPPEGVPATDAVPSGDETAAAAPPTPTPTPTAPPASSGAAAQAEAPAPPAAQLPPVAPAAQPASDPQSAATDEPVERGGAASPATETAAPDDGGDKAADEKVAAVRNRLAEIDRLLADAAK